MGFGLGSGMTPASGSPTHSLTGHCPGRGKVIAWGILIALIPGTGGAGHFAKVFLENIIYLKGREGKESERRERKRERSSICCFILHMAAMARSGPG